MPRPPTSTDGRFRPPTVGRFTENLTMRTEKTYRPVMSGQSTWDPGPTRHQTTPRRRPPSRAIPTTVRCHTVSSNLNRPDGSPTNHRPPGASIAAAYPSPHLIPIPYQPYPPTGPTPITYQTRPRPGPYLSPIRHGPPIGSGHVRRSHTCTVTQSRTSPHTPAPHARPPVPPPRQPHSTHGPYRTHTAQHGAASTRQHRAPSTEQGAQSGGATGQHRARSTRQ